MRPLLTNYSGMTDVAAKTAGIDIHADANGSAMQSLST